MTQVKYRHFLSLIIAQCAIFAGCRLPVADAAADRPKATFGVISDLHVRGDENEQFDNRHLIKALRYFHDQNVDGVLIAGDIADKGLRSQLEYFMQAWKTAFPDDRAADGRAVTKLFIYGNHDLEAWKWGRNPDDIAKDPGLAREAIGFSPANTARVWEEVIGEKYEPIWIKDVRGFKLIGCNWGCEKGLADFLKKHRDELGGPAPFFYTQHGHPKNTVFNDWAWGSDNGTSTAALSEYPNAVAFSGHSHYTLTDERSVWQGAFTSINTSSMRYSSTDYNLRDNAGDNSWGYRKLKMTKVTPQPDVFKGKQGMLVEVYEDRLVIRRREFVYDRSLGEDWVVPLKRRDFTYANRIKARNAPQFADDAKVEVNRIHNKKLSAEVISVNFPRANDVNGCRVFEYEVTALLCEDGIELPVATKRVMSPDYFLPTETANMPGRCDFKQDELPQGARLRFTVRPCDCFNLQGRAIAADYHT